MEKWDLLDKEGNFSGKTMVRGEPIPDGFYHLVVDSWIVDNDGKLLITRRSPEKSYAGMWEPTTGSAKAGETSLQAVIRETAEETGIDISQKDIVFYGRFRHDGVRYFRDVYVIRMDYSLDDVVLQKGETDAAKKVTSEEIDRMTEKGVFLPKNIMFYMDDLFRSLKK